MNTVFAQSRNPWTGQAMTKTNKPYAAPQLIDVDKLVISNDPLPEYRKLVGSKYDAVFAKMKPGQSLKCPMGTAPGHLAGALRKYIDKHGIEADIKTMSNYGDGFGRVWLIAKDSPKLKRAA